MPDLKELLEKLGDLDDEQKAKVRKALEMEPEDVFKKLEEATDEQKSALAKALGIEPAEDDKTLKARLMKLFGMKDEPDPNQDLPEAVRKAVAEVKESVSKAEKRADQAEERLKKAEDDLAKRDKESRVQRMVVKAAKYSHMGSADDISKLLTDVDEKLGDDGLKQVEAALAKGHEALETAKVFEEIGRSNVGKASGGILADVDVKAVELQKADPDLTLEAARAEVWTANPDLFDQYQSERKRAIRAREDS